MPVKWELRENGRAIYVNLIDPVTAAEIVAAAKEQLPLYENATKPINQVVNTTAIKILPNHMLTIARNVPSMSHAKRGHVVVIAASTFIRAIVSMLQRLLRSNKIKVVATEAEAWAYIHQVLEQESAALYSKV